MKHREIIFEESLSDQWSKDLDVIEVPLDDRPLAYVGVAVLLTGLVAAAQVFFLGVVRADEYARRSEANQSRAVFAPAPRGIIYDRYGKVLAENRPAFSAVLLPREFFKESDYGGRTLAAIERILGISLQDVREAIADRTESGSADPIVLKTDVSQDELVAIKAEDLSALDVREGFARTYPAGRAASAFLGYVGLPTADDLGRDPSLRGNDVLGKAGLEVYYDKLLRGTPGVSIRLRDAKGNELAEEKRSDPLAGAPLRTTIDLEFQKYFYDRFRAGLDSLGRTSGAGIALDPQSGEVLALASFPAYDNNLFAVPGKNTEKRAVLASPGEPLFNRAVGGLYSPGSTIKPLHALAALAEGVMSPDREIFSPGYLDVPNRYDPEKPTRFLDWRPQGNVNVYSALAQSSNVYFYIAGGGSPERDPRLGPEWSGNFGVKGLGISRLVEWWKKFRFDEKTGIDLAGEASGFLPTPEWREEKTGRPWLLGDTYNVSIGQGDLTITPIALLDYIAAIANGGTLYEPHLNRETEPAIRSDLSALAKDIKEVQKGMRRTVTSALGTAHLLADLPFPVSGKTGSAQVRGGEQENAFFVGYAPAENPKIAILILVENAKEGSLNAVPIAKDVLRWYGANRKL